MANGNDDVDKTRTIPKGEISWRAATDVGSSLPSAPRGKGSESKVQGGPPDMGMAPPMKELKVGKNPLSNESYVQRIKGMRNEELPLSTPPGEMPGNFPEGPFHPYLSAPKKEAQSGEPPKTSKLPDKKQQDKKQQDKKKQQTAQQKQTGLRWINGPDGKPSVMTNRPSGDVLGKIQGDPFRGGQVLPGTGMTDEQISKGTKFAGTLPEGDGGRILPRTGKQDIDEFNKNQMSAVGRNPMDISNPKNLREGNVRGGALGWYGFGGSEQEQASQQKIADDRRNEHMKILSQYLTPKSMAQINQELDNALKKSEIGYKDSQTARNNEWIRADREREEFARSNPEAETLRALMAEDNKAILAAGADDEARRIAEERFAVHDRAFQEMMNKSRHRQNGSDQTMPAQQYGDAPKGTRPPGDDITVRYVPRGKDKNGKEQYEPVWGQPDPNNKGGFRQVIVLPHQQGLQTQPMGESAPSKKEQGKIVPTQPPKQGSNLTDASQSLALQTNMTGVRG